MRTKAEERKRDLEIAAAILLLQRRAKRGVLAAVQAIGVPVLSRLSVASAEHVLSAVSDKAILALRGTARSGARGISVLPEEFVTASFVALPEDVAAAHRAGLYVSVRWPTVLEAADGDVKKAVAALRPRIEQTAATEAMDAWNSEVSHLSARAYAAGLTVTDTWRALLDACDACSDLDGQRRVRPDTFEDEPPLHRSCFCWLDSDYAERMVA